jgi:hypothetical protein
MKMRTMLLASIASVGLLSAAFAGDITSPTIPALPIKIPAIKPVNCTAGSCSGAYALFTLTDYSQDVALPGIGNSAANDLGLQGGFGYQVWSGQLLAGIQTQWGYEFVSQGVAAPGSHATGEVTAHLGYNFFNGLSPATAQPVTSGQNPFAGLVPTTLLQNSTPYLIGGGCLRHGIMEACAGIGIETAIASSWSAAFEYKNAPTQRSQPDVSVFSLSVKKHFTLGSL